MKFLPIIILFLLSNISFSETILYNSNKSGMLLNEITDNNKGEYYIIKNIDSALYEYKYTFYDNGILTITTIETYSDNFNELLKILRIEGSEEESEYYKNKKIIRIEKIDKDILLNTSYYFYNSRNELSKVEVKDLNDELLYIDQYLRYRDGSLRKLIRTSEDGFVNHWIYKSGNIVETWLIEGNKSNRTKFHEDGVIDSVIEYDNNKEISNETYLYSSSGELLETTKITGDIRIEKKYQDNKVYSFKSLENDRLIKKSEYSYKGDYVSKEIITGHGMKEEYEYFRDEEDEITTVKYYINNNLKRNTSVVDDKSENIEYYRDGIIYLKEYYVEGEKIKKELFHNGLLFKSESLSE